MDMYNRHRPQYFKDMYNTSAFIAKADMLIRNTLEGKKPDLPHFMIFSSEFGGLGKTTAGRLVPIGLNPDMSERDRDRIYRGEKNEYFFEINGGETGKKDDARELARRIEYKRDDMFGIRCVFMINEAHQLTRDAQEVFLQLTENIPENIYIIFTSTDLAAFNEKLRGRAQKFKFNPLEKTGLKQLLADIARKESGRTAPDHIIDQVVEKDGSSIRESINTLGEYLITGNVGEWDSGNLEEDNSLFMEIIRLLEEVALGALVSWSKHFAPQVQRLLGRFSAEEIRLNCMRCLAGVILKGIRGTVHDEEEKNIIIESKSRLYNILGERILHPISYPPHAYLVLLFFSVYTEARNIAKKTIAYRHVKSKERGTYEKTMRQ